MTTLTGPALEDLVVGAADFEDDPRGGFVVHRLPAWARAQTDDILFRFAERCAVGVRLRFSTDATAVALTLRTTEVRRLGAEADVRKEQYLVTVIGDRERIETPLPVGDEYVVAADLSSIEPVFRPETVITIALPSDRDPADPVEIYLPHACGTALLALEADGDVRPEATTGLHWTHYGSSISQGAEARHAIGTWPVRVALSQGWSLHDLAFSGSAQLDPFAARVIADRPADLITLKIGINLVNADSMRRRTMLPALHGLLDTIRAEQPRTPIVLITAVSCPIHEDAPGPTLAGLDLPVARAARREVENDDGALTLAATRAVVRQVYDARVDDDPALTLLDGLDLFGDADAHLLQDALHPSPEGLDLIAARFPTALAKAIEDRPGFSRVASDLH